MGVLLPTMGAHPAVILIADTPKAWGGQRGLPVMREMFSNQFTFIHRPWRENSNFSNVLLF